MLRYEIHEPSGFDAIRAREMETPEPGPGEVRVRMKAWSVNFRDLSMPRGGYPGNEKVLREPPLVPLSDGAGVVDAVGAGVTGLELGDRVISSFFVNWADGELDAVGKASALGGAVDGVLSTQVVLPERAWVRAPEHMTFEEAATLPCAGLTAWAALEGASTTSGHTVLLLGTGGVSIFGLQLALGRGARALLLTSSAEKAERAKKLGAHATFNYIETPEWDRLVLKATGGVGVDHVLEVGGQGTLERSLRSTRISGTVSLIGVLARGEGGVSMLDALFRRITVRGIYVGSRRQLGDLVAACEALQIRPVIDRVFPFSKAPDALRYLKSGAHFGKVVIAAEEPASRV